MPQPSASTEPVSADRESPRSDVSQSWRQAEPGQQSPDDGAGRRRPRRQCRKKTDGPLAPSQFISFLTALPARAARGKPPAV